MDVFSSLETLKEYFGSRLYDALFLLKELVLAPIDFLTNLFSYFISWIEYLVGSLFLIIFISEVIIIIASVTSGRFISTFIEYNIFFFTGLARATLAIIKLLWQAISDILKIFTNVIPFT